jgi:threonine dehydratase
MSELDRDSVLRARETIGGRLHRTPTFSSAAISERVGATVHLKAELFQRTGSFKPRGMLAKLASLGEDEKRRGVVTWSAGNAAQGLAWAAATEGIPCRVFMWRTANPLKVAATQGYGAEVDLESEDAASSFERLQEHVQQTGAVFVSPFDDPVLQSGHGTVGLEIEEDVPRATTVVVPVGGGGLVAGIASALNGNTRVIGVEPEGAPSLTAALEAGHTVRIKPQSIADGLAAPFTGEGTLAVVKERVDEVVLVSEAEIEEAFRFLYTRAKLACEPAGAAATAALLAGKIRLEPGETVVSVVSGGNAAPETASAILARR